VKVTVVVKVRDKVSFGVEVGYDKG
jgi:hypothetical protein